MLRKLMLAVIIALGVVLAVPSAASAASSSDVDGTWGSIDNDGSNQVMMITAAPSGSFDVLLVDDYATICRGGPVLAVGTGGLTRDTLTVRYDVRCYNGNPAGPVTVDYVYTAATNTLTDSVGVVWNHLAG